MFASASTRRTALLLVAALLAVLPFVLHGAAPDAGTPSPSGNGPSPAQIVAAMAAEPATHKLAPELAALSRATDDHRRHLVAVLSTGPLDLEAFAPRVHSFTWPAGEHVSLLEARTTDLPRLAALPGVARVSSGEMRLRRDVPAGLATEGAASLAESGRRAALEAASASMGSFALPAGARAGDGALGRSDRPTRDSRDAGGGSVAGWHDVRDGHRAADAWDMGYRGNGVRAAVLDTGVDFGHPDLQGAWAVLPEGNPYAGWPQVYDPTATYSFVLDRKLGGGSGLRSGQVGLVEPYQDVAAADTMVGGQPAKKACLRILRATDSGPVLDAACLDHVVPESKSGRVRYGHHPDGFLVDAWRPRSNSEIYAPAADAWRDTASLPDTRLGASAVTLQDGRILVAGGTSASGGEARTTYVYDPATGTWLPAGLLDQPLVSTLVRLNDGKVLSISFQTCRLYDPATNGWAATGSMTVSRGNHTATLLADGRVLVAGGGAGLDPALASAEVYDPATGAWRAVAGMKAARRNHVAARLADGRVLVAGGQAGGGDGDPLLASAEIYDPKTNAWLPTGNLREARVNADAVVLSDGRVLAAGGTDKGAEALSSAELFAPATGTWLAAPDMAVPRAFATATLLGDGRVLVAGGYGESLLVPTATAELFDPVALAWRPAADMSTARLMHAAALLPDGNVLVVSGLSDSAAEGVGAGEYVGVLVVDANVAGQYDTVYVDLDKDHDFTDEKSVTKASPLSTHDLDDDGTTDLSGGLLYYLADGTLPVPGAYLWGVEHDVPEAGTLIGLQVDNGIHGTLCASNIASRGRLGAPPWAPTYGNLEGGVPAVINPGIAPAAAIVAVGDTYSALLSMETAWRYVVFGHDPQQPDDDIQIASNSYGFSAVDNDGWDGDSRMIDHYVRAFAPSLTFVKSTGNGAPGYGTLTGPAPATALLVGASTQFGASSSLSITNTNQITFGDVVSFSDRGPGADGRGAPSLTADGANGWGALPLSVMPVFTGLGLSMPLGPWANQPWSGTSRSGPVAAGGAAVVYQAFRSAHGRWPTWEEAQAIMMGGARFTGNDTFTGGAGVLDVADSARIAAGRHGVYALPPAWTAGDYDGQRASGFAKIARAGDRVSGSIAIRNDMSGPLDVTISAKRLREIGSYDVSLDTTLADESDYSSAIPNYLVAIDQKQVPAGTELMVVHGILPMAQADVDGDNEPELENSFKVKVIRHTDIDRNLHLWRDRNQNGAVNFSTDETGSVDWRTSEVDRWELEAVNEDNAESTTWAVSVHHPLERWSDGLHIGVWHMPMQCADQQKPDTCVGRTPLAPNARLQFRVRFYRYDDWPWLGVASRSLRLAASAATPLTATLQIPSTTAPGAYEGAIFVDYDMAPDDQRVPTGGGFELPVRRLTIPVNVNVAAPYDWRGSVTLGGTSARDDSAPYNNGLMYGHQDRLWRPETGDWRFFFLDAADPAPGTLWLMRTRWQDRTSEVADIDTSLWGPVSDRYSDPEDPANDEDDWSDPTWYGPYTLGPLGASAYSYRGGGTWAYQTSSGTDEDWISGPARAGLNEVLLHNVRSSGAVHDLPFDATVSSVRVAPSGFSMFGASCRTVSVTPQIDLPGLRAMTAGWSAPRVWEDIPITTTDVVTQTVQLAEPAARFDVSLAMSGGTVSVLAVWYDANGDGKTPDSELIGLSSEGSNPSVSLAGIQPPGRYVVGFAPTEPPAPGTTYDLHVEAVSGNDVQVSGAPPAMTAGQTYEMEICTQGAQGTEGPLSGVLALGPDTGPAVIRVPVTWFARPPFAIQLPRLSLRFEP